MKKGIFLSSRLFTVRAYYFRTNFPTPAIDSTTVPSVTSVVHERARIQVHDSAGTRYVHIY